MKTHQKSDPKMNQNPSKITPKIDPKKGTEKRGRSRKKPWPAECAKSPKAIISKDFRRKKTKKKANGSVGTRWSAKSGVQKAPTERQVQTGNPHRT